MDETIVRIGQKELETRLSALQQRVTQAKLPVVILFEGFSAAGKGAAISSLILNFDPRGFDVFTTRKPERTERRQMWLQRFMERVPAGGRIAVFDRAWYSGMTQIHQNIKKPALWEAYLLDIDTFERQLADDGYLIIKFFLHISKKEQRKRLQKLLRRPDTAWRVTRRDRRDLKRYGKISAFYRKMVELTDRPYARWHEIDAKKRRDVRGQVFQTVARELEQALERRQAPANCGLGGQTEKAASQTAPYVNVKFRLRAARRIGEVGLDRRLEREEYEERLRAAQGELSRLHNVLYKKQIPMVIGFEGNDAAGKGGGIKRLARALDSRGYTVCPIGAPTPEEQRRHYLWRFYERLPKDGHITIFDRTWYGRVLVERVEGLTPSNRIREAYNEINEFEWLLGERGAILLKFWLAIDKDEQLRRFDERQNTPEKRWKITEEDWRNREKWDAYAAAVDDMLAYTDTEFAPWTIVESNSKPYSRVKVLETVVRAIRERV